MNPHPLQSICPYFAMFPPEFVAEHVEAHTSPGELVFDPFCGRGTALFESLLRGRRAIGVDINPVAACITGAKVDPPTLASAHRRLRQLEAAFDPAIVGDLPESAFFKACFHGHTLKQIVYLRGNLDWKGSRVDRFIAAVLLGCLHGESHKSQNCLSNRMPRTISTKPEYSLKWWAARELLPPERDAFAVLRRMSAFRLASEGPLLRGKVRMRDARQAGSAYPGMAGQVKLFLTSPPYLDTTNYREDQWLRLWFLGGPMLPNSKRDTDDRHSAPEAYWKFLTESWRGCASLAQSGATLTVRMGGKAMSKMELFVGLQGSLERGFYGFKVTALHEGVSTEIRHRQTNVFRPGTDPNRFEHDFVFTLS